ncbi:MAG: hypothetical protein LBH98_03615 [Chitinispirillales bacterium]|nr:hypothetical protein [Chitinispirillales bacterium]
MKKFLILTLIPLCVFAIEFTLKDGTYVSGDLICENKGSLTLKNGNETISIFKKSIKLYDGQDISGIREFILGDNLIVKNKNEIIFIVTTSDDARVKLREVLSDGDEKLLGEKSGVCGDTVKFYVPDGKYYESVEYTRGGEKYYQTSAPFEMKSKCDKFAKAEISLLGFRGEQIPILKGEAQKFKKDGE